MRRKERAVWSLVSLPGSRRRNGVSRTLPDHVAKAMHKADGQFCSSIEPCERVCIWPRPLSWSDSLLKQYRLDDPMIWGVLPNRYFWNPNNMRWALGSHDVCFKNRYVTNFTAMEFASQCRSDVVNFFFPKA
jgi:hypothetical protein